MAFKNRIKILLLLTCLLVIIIGGVVLLSNQSSSRQSGRSDGNIDLLKNQSQQLRYKESVCYETTWNNNLSGRLIGESLPLLYDKGKLFNLSTGQEMPGFVPPSYKPSSLFVKDDLSYSTIFFDPDSNEVYYQEFSKKGISIIHPIKLEDCLKQKINNDLYIKQFQSNKDYIIMLVGTDLQVFNKSNGSLYLSYSNITGFDINSENKLFISSDANKDNRTVYREVDLSSGEVVNKVDRQDRVPAAVQFVESEQLLYFLNFEEVRMYSYDPFKTIDDPLIIARDTSIIETWSHRGFFVDENANFYISIETTQGECTVYRYQQEYFTIPEPTIMLTVTAPYRDSFMEEAILRYERIHPEIDIKYNYEFNTKMDYLRVYGKISYGGDYAERLALKLMTGEAGDIIQTGGSGLAYRELFRTNTFVDVKPLLEQSASFNKLNQKALNGLNIEGTIRGVPLSTANLYLEVNKELWNTLNVDMDYRNMTWSDAISVFEIWREKYPDRPFISVAANGAGRKLHINSFLIANMPDLVNVETKKVDLRQEWFKNVLKKWKDALQDPMFIKTFTNNTSYINWLKGGLFRQGVTNEGQYLDIITWYGMFNEVEGIDTAYVPMLRGEKNRNYIAYSPDLYSISKSSEHKNEAWDFLNFLITTEAQSYVSYYGNNINLEAREIVFDDVAKGSQEYGKKTYDCLNYLRELQDKIDYLYDMDYYVTDLMVPLLDYFDDKLTLDEALDRAEESIWIRINE